MPYVNRDVSGNIVGIFNNPNNKAQEYVENPVIYKNKQNEYSEAIQRELDKKATLLGYDSIHTAVTYADESGVPKFQIEGQALRKWRSLVWDYAYDVLGQVEQGLIEQPAIGDFVAGMPSYVD